MKDSPVVAFLIAAPVVMRAETPGTPPPEPGQHSERRYFYDPAEQYLKSAPSSAVQKLKDGATAAAGTAEINKYFGRAAINKWVKFHTIIEAVEPTPDGRNAARLRASNKPLERDGVTLARLSWLYFPLQNAPRAEEVKAGTEIVVYGQVRRCEVAINPDGSLRFDFDLWKSKVTNP